MGDTVTVEAVKDIIRACGGDVFADRFDFVSDCDGDEVFVWRKCNAYNNKTYIMVRNVSKSFGDGEVCFVVTSSTGKARLLEHRDKDLQALIAEAVAFVKEVVSDDAR